MRSYSGALLASAFLALASPPTQAAPTGRTRTLLDAAWRFHRGDLPGPLSGVPITRWRWQTYDAAGRLPRDPTQAQPDLSTSGADWQDAAPGQDTFQSRPGRAWYRATLGSVPGPHRILHFDSVDDNATVYFNGQMLLRHSGWDDAFDVPLDSAWRDGGPNVVAVLVQNNEGGGGIGAARLQTASNATPPAALAAYNDRGWRTVHLPHDYIVEGTFTPRADAGHGSLPTTPGWYRKTFTIPAAEQGRSVWIDFDGAYRDAQVWLNGRKLGEHPSGYTPFRYDISRLARYGAPNTLAVRVDPRRAEGWWYEGGGIYRHVWLNAADPLHVAPWGTFVTSTVSDPNSAAPASAALTLKTALTNNAAAPANCRLVSEVQAPGGQVVARTVTARTVPAGRTAAITQGVTVVRPALWSLQTPRLYRLVTQVQRGGRTVDTVSTPFGIRTIRFDVNRGFFLNGRHVEIQGTCNHQDFAGVGIGMPDSLQYWRIKKLKAMGSNAYRTSHNPPTAELLDACDKLGMLVMDENRHLGDTESAKTAPGTPYSDFSDLDSLIARDRNHPSVIMWSMCNEEPLQGTPEGARIFTAMKNRVLQLDKTRPITCAMNDGEPHGIALVEDLRGFNYNVWAYDNYHNNQPAMPLYGSETASTVSTRGIYAMQTFQIKQSYERTAPTFYGEQQQGYVNAYDLNAPSWAQTAEVAWQALGTRPFMAGGFVWTGFDYKGEPTPFGWPCVNSHFGILDEAGFPKDNYYYYQAVWGGKPLVHVLPHWNWPGRAGQPVPVWAYSNASKVELFLNGRSLGAKTMPRLGHVEWQVPYTPGTLLAKGYDARGRVIAQDRVTTTGAPAALRLTTDRTSLSADGEDVTMVEVDVVDAQGRIVPTAGNAVRFRVTGAGRVAGVGNGDPSSHEPDQANTRRAFNGRCLVIVGAGEKAGPVRLTATAPGLKGAALSLTAH